MIQNTETGINTIAHPPSGSGITTILWDYNGTLLNDTQLCINSMNELLKKRKLSPLGIEQYREIFTFPVKEYYRKAGFNFKSEAFEKPAMEFIELYERNLPHSFLFAEVIEVLEYFRQAKKKQFIISAMQQNSLESSVRFLGIEGYFIETQGISDHYANGKKESAALLIQKHQLNPESICLIGDTIHDHEVAEYLECECILIANGHQSESRLRNTGRHVLENLNQLIRYF